MDARGARLEKATGEMQAATSVLLQPVLAAGARLHSELEAAGEKSVLIEAGPPKVEYSLREVQVVIRRESGWRKTRKVQTTVLARGDVLAEDPSGQVALAAGETVECTRVREYGWDFAWWSTLGFPPDGAMCRQMANEIPQARSTLLRTVRSELAKARRGAKALNTAPAAGTPGL